MAPPITKAPNGAGTRNEYRSSNGSSFALASVPGARPSGARPDYQLQESLQHLTIQDGKALARSTGIGENNFASRPVLRFEDEQTQVSTSSTKPASLDGKSTASGNAFVLDEKESLRPDDSASVKAAEEEDSLSGMGSGAPSSRIGSEAGGKAFQEQFFEISERTPYPVDRPVIPDLQRIPATDPNLANGTVSPIGNSMHEQVTVPPPRTFPASDSGFSIDYKDPDEKLLEALLSPKDRLFVLRLEHEIINFIENHKEPILQLATPNSFCRLLAHKLADYYALTHHVDGAMSAVRLYRTPYCRIRTPLSSYPQNPASVDVPAPAQPTVKIMRRAGLARNGNRVESDPNTTASSIAASKAGSETGGDDSGRITGLGSPTESNSTRDKPATMTREEREAKYKETRDRIFKGWEDHENTDAAIGQDAAPEASRASSANGRRKTRKQQNIDDGFEARSHFTAYYPTMQYPGHTFDQSPTPPQYFNPCMTPQYQTVSEQNSLSQSMYPVNVGYGYQSTPTPPEYSVPMQQYATANGSMMHEYNGMQPFPSYMQPLPPHLYQQNQPSPAVGQTPPAMSSPSIGGNFMLPRPQPQTSDQQWSSMTAQYLYQQPVGQQQLWPPQNQLQSTSSAPQPIQYPYGQLPYQSSQPGSKHAHPLPGSYSRQQAFNPQTRSFIPGSLVPPQAASNGSPDQFAVGQYQSPTGGSVSMSHPPLLNNVAPLPMTPQFGSLKSTTEQKPQSSRKSQTSFNENQTPAKSTLSKWGTANLPPKPPPPDPPSVDGRHSLPQNVPTHTNIQVVSNGQPMPTFQNGIYSLPTQSHQ
ncbi:MAG: hypothetical protein LQ350_003033 [Teloschistes chrysophthalmus]|nr:MAG: hypothetical protein LQ350_003033 [Niorma chrysophthalma]